MMLVHQSWISVPVAQDVLPQPTVRENRSVSGQYPGSGLFRPGKAAGGYLDWKLPQCYDNSKSDNKICLTRIVTIFWHFFCFLNGSAADS